MKHTIIGMFVLALVFTVACGGNGADGPASSPPPLPDEVSTTNDAGETTFTAPMTIQSDGGPGTDAGNGAEAGPAIHLEGAGRRVPGNCGFAQLTVRAATRGYDLVLLSTMGVIGRGFYTVYTNGVFNVPTAGGIHGEDSILWSTRPRSTLFGPGIHPTRAYAFGTVFTARAICGFVVSAPWN